tara:strand:- start:411 stop:566 length:156 start_codon:yes stop_codon:yes gene_type:complete
VVVDRKVYGFKKIKTLKKNAIVTVAMSVIAIQKIANVVVTKKRRVINEKEN